MSRLIVKLILLSVIRKPVGALIRVLAHRIPKKQSLVLFGARKGRWYMDCSRHVYEWILENRADLQPIWMTWSRSVHRELRAKGYPVCRAQSLKGLYLLARAPLALISSQLYDIAVIPESIPNSLRVIFLGHGKSVKSASLTFRSGHSRRFRSALSRAGQHIDTAIATSPYIAQLAALDNGLPIERFAVTGYPRNDMLLEPTPIAVQAWESYLEGSSPQMTALYAPTWRQRGEPTRFFPFDDFDPHALGELLEKTRTLLLLRPHEHDLLYEPSVGDFLRSLAQNHPWIKICDQHTFANVNQVLPFVDVLISDYSSIYHDFLLLDRSIVLIPYDYESFARTQGFMYDYLAHLPGPAVSTQKELLHALEDAIEGRDPYAGKRRALQAMIHTHTDAGSCRRVVKLIDEQLGTRAPHEDTEEIAR